MVYLFSFMALFCLGYFILLSIYNGPSNPFHYLWLAFAVILFFVIRFWNGIGFIRTVFVLLVFVGMIVWCLLVCMILSEGKKEVFENADYLIILGAGLQKDVVPPSLKARLDKGAGYLMENKKTLCFVSGGQGFNETVTEASAMKKYLISIGISGERIIEEDASVNTDQNIAFCKKLMEDKNGSIVIVTNRFHLYRAVRIARKQGLEKIAGLAAADNKVMALSYYLREAMAIIRYKAEGRI